MLGCGKTQQVDYTPSDRAVLHDRAEQPDEVLWHAIQDTLRQHRFQIDRLDRRAGIITTFPEVSQHFFEIWRKDVASARDFWEATINPIRRWVEVRMADKTTDDQHGLTVLVHKERLSSPDRQFNSTGAAYQFFGDSLPSTSGHPRVTPEYDRWLDLGRDAAMEDHLLRQIVAHARARAHDVQGG